METMFLLITTQYLKLKYLSNCEKYAKQKRKKNGKQKKKTGMLINSWKSVITFYQLKILGPKDTISIPFQQTI
jgi:hypothetical protein